MIVTDVGFPAKTFSRLNVFHSCSLSVCPVFTPDSEILGLCLFYFVIPIRKSGLVCTFEYEIRDISWQYLNFSLSKNRTTRAKCDRLIVHLAADQQALMLVSFQTVLAIAIIFSNFTDFFLHFQNSLTLELSFLRLP